MRKPKKKYDAAWHRAYYAKTRKRRQERKRITGPARTREIRKKLLAYKAERPCVDCGEKDPIVLQCSYLDKSTRVLEISTMLKDRWGWRRISEELPKTESVCANCMMRRAARGEVP